MMPWAVVLGGGGIETVRAFQLAGIRCAVVAPAGDVTRYSRARSLLEWDKRLTGDPDNTEVPDRLVAWARTQPERPVLYSCTDESMLFVSRHRERLAAGFRFLVSDPELVETMADKQRFAGLVERLALAVPTTVSVPAGAAEIPPGVLELGFPLIVKPAMRNPDWWRVARNKVKALVIESEAALRARWPELAAMGQPFVAQQYVAGPESETESYHVYADEDGEVAAEFTGRKLRTYPAECGLTTALTITDDQDLRDTGQKLVELIGLRGVAKFDFKRAPDGQLYLFEVNARCNLWLHAGARAGVNIPAVMHSDLTGRPRPMVGAPRAMNWVHPKDVRAARVDGVPMGRWLRYAAGAGAKAFWSWRDPVPFGAVALAHLRSRDFS